MAFLPEDFYVPTLVAGLRFQLRPISVHDVVRYFDAVMSSRERLWHQFGGIWEWPSPELTLEQNLVNLAWHQKEGELRRSFTYAVLTPDEARLLGCVYIFPPRKAGADTEVGFWVRSDEDDNDLEKELEEFVREWLDATWPFESVRFPGRDMSWYEWQALPAVT
ncbi:MAG TPA: GNAT family N-acetyltransferase [Streptosporangiaceae bacterium]|nr:GNAT family N-acetyltransferase [Streptosporangiaceae bacterium]